MTSYMLIALCLIALFAGGASAANAGPSEHGALRVDGVQLTDSWGEAIQLRGMSTHGLRWFPEYINYAAIMDTKARGANLFRLAMYADSSNGGYSESWEAAQISKQLMYIGIENALAADMYVIVDWHLLKDENPLRIQDQAIEFFTEVSRRYPDHPAIIYEICNEPNGDTTWADIRRYAEAVIPVIREASPGAVILVGTPHWSADVLSVLEGPLDFPDVMYSFHLYTGFRSHEFRNKLTTARKEGLPIFVSEWGMSSDEETGEMNYIRGIEFIRFMRDNKLSWASWSLSNKDEDFSAIRPEVTKFSGWADEELTEVGKILFKGLSGQ